MMHALFGDNRSYIASRSSLFGMQETRAGPSSQCYIGPRLGHGRGDNRQRHKANYYTS